MNKSLILLPILTVLIFGYTEAFAQDPKLATFQETAQIIIDKSISNNVTAAITLQSTSNQEIRIPVDLTNKIQNTEKILAVILTSEEQCVLGVVQDESCIMINLDVREIEGGIKEIQDTGRRIGDTLIDDINSAFDTDAKFHSVFLHQKDETNRALETSGVVSGQGTFSAVYTMPREDSNTMFEKFSTILLPKEIRESGGFIDIAKKLSAEQDARITLSIIPQNGISLYQLKLSVDYPNSAEEIQSVSPLEFLKSDNLIRSDYFSNDFYPLNSLLKVVLLSKEPIKVDEINTNIIPGVIRDGEPFPAEISTDGWFFDQASGGKIEATYLFGKKSSVGKNDLVFTIGPIDGSDNGIGTTPNTNEIDSFQIIILVGIIMAAAGASIYYLKGFRGKN